ncbi:ORF6N domain-containing protein [Clostridium neonatale]
MSKLIPLEFNNQRIMTTKTLAEQFGTEETNIKTNFNRNKERFIEGKHYYQLQGEELKGFKKLVTESNDQIISNKTTILTLWTDRGAARHAKILDTDEAWEVYEELEDTYFRIKEKLN